MQEYHKSTQSGTQLCCLQPKQPLTSSIPMDTNSRDRSLFGHASPPQLEFYTIRNNVNHPFDLQCTVSDIPGRAP